MSRFSPLGLLAVVALSFSLSGCGSTPPTTNLPAPARTTQSPTDPSIGNQPGPTFASFPFSGGNAKPQTPPPHVTARAAIVLHANSGTVIYAKNPDVRYPVASTQKLLTGLILAEAGNMNKSVRVAYEDTTVEPTKMGLKSGDVYRKEDLLRAVMVRSSNDIAHCLARDHAGSLANFGAMMNSRARSLGMRNSYFANPSGLPGPTQYSTARDLSILAVAAIQNSFLRSVVQTKSLNFRFADGRTKTITNTNQVLLKNPYCTGMKTGYTNAAGRCLVSSGTANGRNIIVVVLGSQTPAIWNESNGLLNWGLEL